MESYPLHLVEFVNMFRWQLVVYTFVIFVSIPLIAIAIHFWRNWDFAKTCAGINVFFAAGSASMLLLLAFSQTDVVPDSMHTFDQPRRTAYYDAPRPVIEQNRTDGVTHRTVRRKHKDSCEGHDMIGRMISGCRKN